jgi:hypothetical protein
VSLILYRREGCDLCELAEQALGAAGVVGWTSIDVGWQGELADRYGWTLPILRDEIGARELAWPFDAHAVRRFLGA